MGGQHPWYSLVDGPELQQGDILRQFDVLVPVDDRGSFETLEAELKTFDLVIMTQSCDLAQAKARSLLLCPLYELWTFVNFARAQGQNWSSDMGERLRQGNIPGYHLLNDFSHGKMRLPLSVVDFHEVYSAPVGQVRNFAANMGQRLRLDPPYKEHLAQAFARFFMRVGLPAAIAPEKLKQPEPPS